MRESLVRIQPRQPKLRAPEDFSLGGSKALLACGAGAGLADDDGDLPGDIHLNLIFPLSCDSDTRWLKAHIITSSFLIGPAPRALFPWTVLAEASNTKEYNIRYAGCQEVMWRIAQITFASRRSSASDRDRVGFNPRWLTSSETIVWISADTGSCSRRNASILSPTEHIEPCIYHPYCTSLTVQKSAAKAVLER